MTGDDIRRENLRLLSGRFETVAAFARAMGYDEDTYIRNVLNRAKRTGGKIVVLGKVKARELEQRWNRTMSPKLPVGAMDLPNLGLSESEGEFSLKGVSEKMKKRDPITDAIADISDRLWEENRRQLLQVAVTLITDQQASPPGEKRG